MEVNPQLKKAAADVVSSQNVTAAVRVPEVPGIFVSVADDPTIQIMAAFRCDGIQYVIGPKKKGR